MVVMMVGRALEMQQLMELLLRFGQRHTRAGMGQRLPAQAEGENKGNEPAEHAAQSIRPPCHAFPAQDSGRIGAMKYDARFHGTTQTRAWGFGLGLALALGTQQAWAAELSPQDAELAAKSEAAFGKQNGQRFDARAVSMAAASLRTDTTTVTLAPGKGAEVQGVIAAGQSFVFHWVASGDVAVDMHGERHDAKDEYTSYSVEGSQREASGTFTAPFAGTHGWYWKNKGKQPVTVQVTLTGFQTRLVRPGQP